jgi:hypothetical protein
VTCAVDVRLEEPHLFDNCTKNGRSGYIVFTIYLAGIWGQETTFLMAFVISALPE